MLDKIELLCVNLVSKLNGLELDVVICRMAFPRRTQAEIMERFTHNVEILAARLDQHANNQAATIEALKLMQETLRKRREEARG